MNAKFEICSKCPHLKEESEAGEDVVYHVCNLKKTRDWRSTEGTNNIVASYDVFERALLRWRVEIPEDCPYKLEYVLNENRS